MRMPERIRRPGDPDRGVKPYDVWQIRLPQPDGRLKFRIFRTKKEAESASREHEDALRSGVDMEDRTIAQVEAEFLEWAFDGLRQATLNQAKLCAKKIVAEFGKWPIKKLDDNEIRKWLKRMTTAAPARHAAEVERIKAKLSARAQDKRAHGARRKLAEMEADAEVIAKRIARTGPRAANKALEHLRRMYRFAVAKKYCVSNPCDLVKTLKPTKPKLSSGAKKTKAKVVYTPAQVARLVEAAPEEYRAALLVLAYAGLRIGELAALEWDDLELDQRRLHVSKQIESCTGEVTEPKTEAGVRYVSLPGLVVTALRKHQLRTRLASGSTLVFPYHMRRFRSGVFFPAIRRAGLHRIKLHDLRHTAASIMIAAKVDIACVSAQLGHANVAITLSTYTHEVEQAGEESSVAAKTEAFINAQGGGGFLVVSDKSGTAAEVAGAA